MQTQSLFPTLPVDIEPLICFHDESGSFHCDECFGVGWLLMSPSEMKAAIDRIKKYKEQYKCGSEVHFQKIDSDNREYQVAQHLLRDFISGGIGGRFVCWLVHRRQLDASKTPSEFYQIGYLAYNFYTAKTLKNGINYWYKKKSPQISLHMISDEKARRFSGGDNFGQYVPRAVKQWAKVKDLQVRDVQVLPSDERCSGDDRSLIIQLVDLLIGCAVQLAVSRSRNPYKIKLSRILVELLSQKGKFISQRIPPKTKHDPKLGTVIMWEDGLSQSSPVPQDGLPTADSWGRVE
jgi:hypothetical protein